MIEGQASVDALLQRFVAYAKGRRDIRTAMVVGSRARAVQPADEWSDVDIMLITTNPKRYLLSTAWLADVGEPWVTYIIRGPVGDRNVRHAVFDGGVAVDFAIVSSLETRWGGLLLRFLTRMPGALRLLPRGLALQIDSWFASLRKGSPRVLLDKDGAASRLADICAPRAEWPRPTDHEFAEVVNAFWCLSIWQSKQALRGELWMANNVCGRR